MSAASIDWPVALAVAAVPPLALAIDRWFGEPPACVHPVVWMGRLLDALARRVPAAPAGWAFAGGMLGWCAGALPVVAIAWVTQQAIWQVFPATLPGGVRAAAAALAFAFLLKPLLSLRLLLTEGQAVETALAESLGAGRVRTARLCSRDTRALDATTLRETTIESLSENLVDSVVAPLFWFVLAGLPGAALYRWANTADAMWGYRDARREWSGKFAARADDVLSWWPARLAAPLLWPASLGWRSGRRPGRQLRVEAARTPSPNGGWPMAATALRLGVRLGKPGVYVLNADGRSVDERDIDRAARLARRAGWCAAWALGVPALVLAAAAPALFGAA